MEILQEKRQKIFEADADDSNRSYSNESAIIEDNKLGYPLIKDQLNEQSTLFQPLDLQVHLLTNKPQEEIYHRKVSFNDLNLYKQTTDNIQQQNQFWQQKKKSILKKQKDDFEQVKMKSLIRKNLSQLDQQSLDQKQNQFSINDNTLKHPLKT